MCNILKKGKEGNKEFFYFFALYPLIAPSALLWVIPVYACTLILLKKYPHVAGFIATFFTLIGIYPLLAVLLIFFTEERRAFGIGAFVGLSIGFLLPLTLYPPSEYLPALGVWYSGFRSPLPELANGHLSDYSLMGLLRIGTPISPRWHWLILVQVFHLFLLPLLRVARSEHPSSKAEIFTGAALTFIALFSGLNEPRSLLLATTGIMLWAIYSKIYAKWLTLTASILSWVINATTLLTITIKPQLLEVHTITIAASTLLPLLPIFVMQVVELWSGKVKG